LSSRISDVYKDKYPDIYENALDIYNSVLEWKWTEKERLEKTQKFWRKYWSVLSKALNFLDVWESESSKTDKIVLLEKDKNPIFNKYYETVRAYTWISWAFNKELMDDESWEHWLGWLNHKEIIKRYFRMDSWRSIPSQNISVVERLWRKLSEDINSVTSKDMSIEDWDDLINKRKYLKLIFRDLFSGFITNHPDKIFLKKYVEASPFKDDMRKWWVTEDLIAEFLNYSSWEIEAWSPWSDAIIDKVIDNILNWNSVEISNPIFETIDRFKDKTDEITPKKEDN
jgi:hypothetical protein